MTNHRHGSSRITTNVDVQTESHSMDPAIAKGDHYQPDESTKVDVQTVRLMDPDAVSSQDSLEVCRCLIPLTA